MGPHRGFTLIEVLIVLALLAAASSGFAALYARTLQTQRYVDLKNAVNDLRVELRQTDCRATLAAAACNGTTPVQLLKKVNGQLLPLLTPSNELGFRVGQIPIKSTCTPAGIQVQIPRLSPNQGLARDGARNYELRNLFDPVSTRLCTSPAGPEPITPKGMCLIRTAEISYPTSPANAANMRTVTLTCPSEYPVAMSAQLVPACSSDTWVSVVNNDAAGIPTGVTCGLRFFWDNPAYGSSERSSMQASCASIGQSSVRATCQTVCCNF